MIFKEQMHPCVHPSQSTTAGTVNENIYSPLFLDDQKTHVHTTYLDAHRILQLKCVKLSQEPVVSYERPSCAPKQKQQPYQLKTNGGNTHPA